MLASFWEAVYLWFQPINSPHLVFQYQKTVMMRIILREFTMESMRELFIQNSKMLGMGLEGLFFLQEAPTKVGSLGIRWMGGGNYFTLLEDWHMKDIGRTVSLRAMGNFLMKIPSILQASTAPISTWFSRTQSRDTGSFTKEIWVTIWNRAMACGCYKMAKNTMGNFMRIGLRGMEHSTARKSALKETGKTTSSSTSSRGSDNLNSLIQELIGRVV